jgi:ribosomal protein S18 acetylase RimI-like enzyme
LIHYRTFRNTDPPALVDIWRSRAQERGLIQPMSLALLEELVLSKPYFDNAGVILAVDDDRPVGFVHAGFGPNANQSGLSRETGVTCMVIVRPEFRRLGIGKELLARGEAYLQSRGAKVLYGGGIRPWNPFYLGLYGGSELPGVLESDQAAQALYRTGGYEPVDRVRLYHCDLATFRAPMDRKQIQIRRQRSVNMVADPPASTWWEACTLGCFDRTRFDLVSRASGAPSASLMVWSMEPISTSRGVRTAALVDMEVAPGERRQGLVTFLLGEAFKQLQSQGVSIVEAQAMEENLAAIGLLEKLHFQQVDQGTVFRKEAPANL